MLRGVEHGTGAVAVLEDELRRRLYLMVRRAARSMTREDVASEAGISRRLAAFHLDKLVERGLLQMHYARPPGRSGPGAGRTAKWYEPSTLEVDVSIPERRYDLAAQILLRAITSHSADEPAAAAALRVAAATGADIGQGVRNERRLGRLGPERALATATEVLEDYGFEPHRPGPEEVALANCPFHTLAQEASDLVCHINQAFIDGLVRGLGNRTVQVDMAPAPGACCVTLRRAGAEAD